MDLFNCMRVFIRVSEVGSFTGVAKLLNVSTPHVSRCVSDLEASVQARLIQRNTRHQSLTEAGARYLESCREIIAKVDEAALEANKSCLTPQGCLKILSDIEFGIEHLAEMMAAYTKDHPDVHLELTLTSGTSNLIDEQQDMQIVICKHDTLPSSDRVAQHLGGFSSVICAAPGYLRNFKKPQSLQDLRKHRILGFNNDRQNEIADYENIRGLLDSQGNGLKANLAQTLRDSAIAGMGVCIIPDYIASQALISGKLQRLLPTIELHPQSVYAVYSSRKYLDAKIRTWVSFLKSTIPKRLSDSNKIVANPNHFYHQRIFR